MPDDLFYHSQSSQQTLAEGIAEYFSTYSSELSTRKLSIEAVEFFRCHDTLHVIWGCDMSLEDEIVVTIASFTPYGAVCVCRSDGRGTTLRNTRLCRLSRFELSLEYGCPNTKLLPTRVCEANGA